MQDTVERKLTAILYADVAGYSRLTGQDEEGTHRVLSSSLDTITTLIERYKGKVLHFAGDAVLAEFASVVNALTCAVVIQRDLKVGNEEIPVERRLEFRIGVNLGDVIVDRNEIYGDGVNVAARLESLAEPGGICISRSVLDQVKNKMELGYESLGEQRVKNIADPVQAYRVILAPKAAGIVVGEKKVRLSQTQSWILAFTVLVFVSIGTIAIWSGYLDSDKPGVLALPAKPSIAVLPFKNLSGNLEQDYFSDGITEDIITDLSKFQDLFVIASNTVFTYKGKPTNVKEVSKDLGVRYILEGSVQKTDRKVRVNAQLIDGGTGHHVWAERFVRDLEDLFALQDEIVSAIVGTLATQVDAVERERAMRKDTNDLAAYDYLLRGREYRSRATSAANAEARRLFQKAIELDPTYASAYVEEGWSYVDMVRFGWTAAPSDALQEAHNLAQKVLSFDEANASAHRLLGWTYLKWNEYDLAAHEFNRALELNPNDAESFDALGAVMLYTGEIKAAIEAQETAFRFSPNQPPRSFVHLGLAYYLAGRYDDTIRTMEQSLGKNPDLVVHHVILAAAHGQAGHLEDAAQAATKVRRLHPFFEVDSFGSAFRDAADRAKLAEGLRKAGLE
ncbi:MAG: adenylate/guanylate cyclase domain-containing protein [Arenicellales bacterium]|nr:adenylate/guanylate cyclase domain-containing protein [Arenicellales bacterium]